MNKTKKILSIILAVMMILTAVPLASLTAFATESYDPSTATLTISGVVDLGMQEDFEASFPGCKKIVISEGITVIGERAFLGLPIESVELPSTLTSIGDSAFRNCGNLKSIVIPSGVTSIGSQAFGNCGSLESVVIPGSVTSIGDNAFSLCTTLESVVIPDSVTSIGNSAFSGCKSLKSIKLPSGLKIIPDNMLNNAESLESIEIPDSVTSIGESAFMNAGLKTLTIPANVESIGYMFIDCCPIKCLKFLGQPTTGLDEGLFYYVGNEEEGGGPIAELILPESWSGEPAGSTGDTFMWLDGVFTFNHIDADNDCICDNCGYDNSFVIDENGVLTAYNGAGGNVVIPDSVKSIADYVFNGKTSITGITIPDSVTTIGNYAFANCKGVSEIIIPDSVTSIGNYAFAGCQETSLSIGNKVETIGNNAFISNSKLLSVTIPDSVKSIGLGAFQNCSALAYLTIGSGVKTIGDSAFAYSSIKEVTIPGNVETIGNSLFSDCTALKEVTICDGVSKISNNAFARSTNIEKVTIADSVKEIGDNAFMNCSKITDLVIPDSVVKIGYTAFYNCSSLKTLTISDNVTSLGSGAFSSCSSLETVFYPCSSAEDSVKNIMSTYGNYTYTQLDHDFVNGICTICGDEEFDLATYKQTLYDDLSTFIDDNISPDMQMLDSFQKLLGKVPTAVEAAETKDEVDEIRAQAFQTLDEFIPDEYTVTVQGAGVADLELVPEKSTKYYIATVNISYTNGINDDGEWFVYWKDVDTGEIVSSYSTYKFFVTKDIKLEPVYVAPGGHEEHGNYNDERAKAVITSRMVKSENNDNGTFSLISEYSVSAVAMPAALQSHGIICTTDETLANETDLVCTNDAVEKYAAVKTATDYVGTQKTTLEVSEPTTVYARPYIVDGDGNVYYGEMKNYFLDPTPSVIVDGYEDEIVFCGAEDYSLDVAQADEVVPTAVETEPETAETANWFTTLISILTTIINWFMQILGI